MKYALFGDSRIGGRTNNEDRFGHQATRDALVMVVADGLGGHLHGEVAAEAAVQSILATFQRQARPRLDNPQAFLADAMAGAHTAILAQAGLRKLAEPPRTTCVACVVQDGTACWAHAGDSRLYLLRNGRVIARTQDHTHVQALLDAGLIGAAEAQHHPRRNALTNCLGGDLTPRFDFSAPQALKRGDVVLLCSDGLWGPLADDTPLAMLASRDAVQAAPGLLDRVETAAGLGRDNLTLLLMSWESGAAVAVDTPQAVTAWTEEDFSRTLKTSLRRLHEKE